MTNLSLRFSKQYSSIDDLPMYNWQKIHETNSLKWLFIKKVDIENTPELITLWGKIYDEYLLTFGLSNDFKEVLALKKSIAIQKAEFIIKEDRVLLNYIVADEERLKSLYEKTKGGADFRESLVHLEKMQGIKINTRKITVADYYNYLRWLNKSNKRM